MDVEERAAIAIEFHNKLWDVEWPDIMDLGKLAHHTKLVIATLQTLKLSDAESWVYVIRLAVTQAYFMGLAASDAEPPELNEEEKLKFAVRADELREEWEAHWEHEHLAIALRKVLGLKRTVVSPDALECTSCGEREALPRFQDPELDARIVASRINSFARRHGEE